MFLPCLCLLLFNAFAVLPSIVAENYDVKTVVMRRWLQDPKNRLSIEYALGGNDHPLNAALKVINSSTLRLEDGDYQRCVEDASFAFESTNWEALKMKDASVKIPEGLLEFSFTHLGNWDECVSVRDVSIVPDHQFNGQMCLVNFHPTFSSEFQMGGVANLSDEKLSTRLNERDVNILSLLSLRLGICLPSTCRAGHVKKIFDHYLMPEYTSFTADVTDVDCTTLDREHLDATEWVAIGIFIVFGCVIISSTLYDLLFPGDRKRKVLVAFSVISNGKKLLAAPKGGDQTLSCLHGIRFLSMCWVVVGHRYVITVSMVNINPMFSVKFQNEWWRIGIPNGTLSVDTFLLLSGLLLGYLFFKQHPKARRLNLPLYYLHRYIRLTPALAMMALLTASLLYRFNYGPLWPASLGMYRDFCRDNWWNVLLYVNNYVDPTRTCVSQSWYLMVDMQLYWLSPLLIIPMARSRKYAICLIPLLSIIGLVTTFLISLLLELPANALAVTDVDVVNDFLKYIYVPSYTRFVPYLIGLSLGYVLGDRQSRGIQRRPLPFLKSVFAWIIAAALMLVPLCVGYEFVHNPLPTNVTTAFYSALFRPVWAAGVAVIVYLCANGNGGPANIFLSWTGFHILGRLTYCIYLVHPLLQLTELSAVKTYNHVSDEEVLTAFASDLMISIICAAVLSVTCETPFLVLEKELLGESRGRKATNSPLPVQTSNETITSHLEVDKNNEKLSGGNV